MKAYLAITGTLFALIAIAHLLRAIVERGAFATNRVEYLSMALLGAIAAALSAWAWRLFLGQMRKN